MNYLKIFILIRLIVYFIKKIYKQKCQANHLTPNTKINLYLNPSFLKSYTFKIANSRSKLIAL